MRLTRTDHTLVIETPSGPLPIRQIIGVGRNYADHAKELGNEAQRERPMLFTKSLASLALSGESIVIPEICQDTPQVDYEGELAVVIGRAAKDVSEKDALSFVLGYCAANDVSARWWQKQGSGGQFYRGKSFDTFCPLGPEVVPAAKVPDPGKLRLRTRLNGQTMQDGSTSDMIFSVAQLISEISRGATLVPGTVILTGTPAGVGAGRTPPVFLKDGDAVEVEIEGVGVLKNAVRAQK